MDHTVVLFPQMDLTVGSNGCVVCMSICSMSLRGMVSTWYGLYVVWSLRGMVSTWYGLYVVWSLHGMVSMWYGLYMVCLYMVCLYVVCLYCARPLIWTGPLSRTVTRYHSPVLELSSHRPYFVPFAVSH